MNSETQPWGDVATEDYVVTWDIANLQLYWASLPQEDWIMNQTWNGTALKIYLYSYYSNAKMISKNITLMIILVPILITSYSIEHHEQ